MPPSNTVDIACGGKKSVSQIADLGTSDFQSVQWLDFVLGQWNGTERPIPLFCRSRTALDVAASAAYVKIYSSQTNGSTILSGNDEVDECRRRRRRRRRKARFPSSMTK